MYEQTGSELAFQGELVGPGLQSNRDLLAEHHWLVFRAYDIKAGRFIDPATTQTLCIQLGFEHVEVLDDDIDVFNKLHSVDEMLEAAEGKTASGNEREGLVFKSVDEPYVSFKAVSNKYLLKQKD